MPVLLWLRPYAATALATLWASFIWSFLTIQPSGMLLLALVVGAISIAAWLSNPRALLIELRQGLSWPARFGLIGVITACGPIASAYMPASFSVLSGPDSLEFGAPTPGSVAASVIAGYLIFILYPCRKPHFASTWTSLVGVAFGFAYFVLFEVWWAAMIVAPVVRGITLFAIFFWGGHARASMPAAPSHLT